MARITNAIIANNVRRNLQEATQRLQEAQKRVATGLAIDKPSDDPVRANRILNLRSSIAQNEQFVSNANHGEALLNVANGSYEDVSNILLRAQDLAHQALSGSNVPGDFKFFGEEVSQLIEGVLDSANTDFAGIGLFTGNTTDRAAFVAERETTTQLARSFQLQGDFGTGDNRIVLSLDEARGNIEPGDIIRIADNNNFEDAIVESVETVLRDNQVIVTLTRPLQENFLRTEDAKITKTINVGQGEITSIRYIGDRGVHEERVGRTAFIPTTTPGDIAFQRVFEQLLRFRDALRSGGLEGVDQLTRNLEDSTDHIAQLQTEAGTKIQRLNTLRTRLGDSTLALQNFMQQIEQVSISDAVIDFQTQETILNATLSTGARVLIPSLFNFL